MNDETNPSQRYIGQVYTALAAYSESLDGNVAILGDFNWNIVWDGSPKSPLCGDFSDTIEVLQERGLKSSYHHMTGDEFGDEDSPTFYMHKKAERPCHIGYTFIPEPIL